MRQTSFYSFSFPTSRSAFLFSGRSKIAAWHSLVLTLFLLLFPLPLTAQILQGEWVTQTQKQIQDVRMVPLRVILVDADSRPVPATEVHVRMLRHAFPFGLEISAKDMSEIIEAGPARLDRPVWRCLNALSLENLSSWSAMQPRPDELFTAPLDQALAWCETHGFATRLGSVISNDPHNLPPWAAALQGQEFQTALENRLATLLPRYAKRVGGVDLFSEVLTYDVVGDRLGPAMVRRLFEQARVLAPQAPVGIRFSDTLSSDRLQAMVRQVRDYEQLFVSIDALAVRANFQGTVMHPQLARALNWAGETGKPLEITGLEVAGSSPAAAAINTEIVLRTLFASPYVKGIYWARFEAQSYKDSTFALLNERGQPTEAGKIVDGLIRRLWWTDASYKSDELGNIQTRVYAGLYELSAQLPTGQQVRLEVFLAPQAQERVAVLQPLPHATIPATEPATAPAE
ncbi:MAG: endo-1,4-beta-xylanase [Phycisphaeraceae bacterium]|nr:endo-1,4-beta-xylanase [Phycisphaeraceae bacterium]